MAYPPRRRTGSVPPVQSIFDGFRKLALNATAAAITEAAPEDTNDFVVGYENPVAWHRRYKTRVDQLKKDVLFDNLDMKNITSDQYSGNVKPEYIKWKM